MKRNILSLFLALMILLSLPLPAFAAAGLPMVIDQADLLAQAEEAALEEMAQDLRSQIEMDVVILTVNSLEEKSAQSFADDYYDDHGYGYDADGSGILFLLAMAEREWYISTCGDAITSVSDYEIQQLGESAAWYFSDEDYAEGFGLYLTLLPEYMDVDTYNSTAAGYDEPFSIHDSERETVYYEEYTPNILLSLVIGIITATAVVLGMRYSMNTKRQQRGASSYLKSGSFHLTRQQDMFLYSNVSKVRKQQNNSSSGGSSVHRSSSGRRHGGGGGRF